MFISFVFLFVANQEDFMADAGVLSPTEFAKRMLNKDERKESIQNIKENIKGSLNEIRHGVKDTVKVLKNLQVIVIERFNHLVIIVRSSFNIELFFSICPMDIVDI